jgi:hypothetical protein
MKRLFKRLPIDPDITEQAAAVSKAIDADNSYRDPDAGVLDWADLPPDAPVDNVVEVRKPRKTAERRTSEPSGEELEALARLAAEAEAEAREIGGGRNER